MNRNSTAFLTLAALTAAIIASPSAQAQTFTTLHSFDGTDGFLPFAGLMQATNGAFYGTTYQGGANGYGTIYSLTPSGTLATLHSFNNVDGAYPEAALVQATNGAFYGTAYQGGANGYGSIFSITPSGTLTPLYSFDKVDGAYPDAGLIQATNGAFYGVTFHGGNGGHNKDGTVFAITTRGTLTTIGRFNGANGAYPEAGLIQASDGNLYGTTSEGGTFNSGMVFKSTLSGVRTVLYSFCSQSSCTDGAYPEAPLVQGGDGNFYGTTTAGGLGFGTAYQITPSGTLTTLYSFCSQSSCTDGSTPFAGLIQSTDGNFYGTTNEGGANGSGTVFKMTPSGAMTILHSFNGTDGAKPQAGLMQATNGSFYGTTGAGGVNDAGTIFRLSVGLAPFVETQTASGKVGAAVKILGSNLTGSSSVTFNGTAATFRVVSASEITTTVPAGSTSGTVAVTTPHGTLNSNKSFIVSP